MAEDYERYLSEVHSAFQAPSEVIRRAAKGLTATPLKGVRRIVAGESNEVYALAFEDGLEVILRIARQSRFGFAHERWAIDQCQARGMLVPAMLMSDRYEVDGEALDVCILEKIDGEPLVDRLDLPRATLRSIVREAGEWLSRLHTIPVTGAGDLDGDGRGQFGSYAELIEDFMRQAPAFVAAAERNRFDADAARRAFRFIEHTAGDRAPLRVCLTHNDFTASHLMVKDGKLTGVIDFGQVSAEPPVNEFAKWAFWEGDSLPVAWLREGYADKSLFGDGYAELFRMMRLFNGLWALYWYDLRGYAGGVEDAKAKLYADIAAI